MKITANKYTPYFPIHPGEIIKDKIEYRSMPQSRLASHYLIVQKSQRKLINISGINIKDIFLNLAQQNDRDIHTYHHQRI
jgi:hypothetical protein